MTLASLVLGEEADYSNTIVGDTDCFNFSQRDDGIKEGLEVFLLRLNSSDTNVCLGRDLSVVNVLANGGEDHVPNSHVVLNKVASVAV